MNRSPLRLLVGSILLLAAPLFAAESKQPLLVEDFEGTPVGEIPSGYTKSGAIGVVEEVAHGGKKALRLEAAVKGSRMLTKRGPEIAALGGQHWGRLYYKVQLPVPSPIVPEGKTSAIIHATLVGGKAQSPLAQDPIEVRFVGNIIKMNGDFQYLYNVQPQKRPEFARMGKKPFQFKDGWTLVEWFADYETQTYKFFVDGQELPEMGFSQGAGKYEKAEIPAVFDSLSFGWTNYQPASGTGFVAWIDDLALGKERLGDQKFTLLPAAKK